MSRRKESRSLRSGKVCHSRPADLEEAQEFVSLFMSLPERERSVMIERIKYFLDHPAKFAHRHMAEVIVTLEKQFPMPA